MAESSRTRGGGVVVPSIVGKGDEKGEQGAIIAAAREYLKTAADAAMAASEIRIEKVAGGFARATVIPPGNATDPATLFLRKTGGKWKGISLGTFWEEADYRALGIPVGVR